MVSEQEVAALRRRWIQLKGNLLNEGALSNGEWDNWWSFILENYSSDCRRYHTLRHLTELFWHWDRACERNLLKRPALVAIAIWFHDVIYNGVNKQDEDASADEFERFGREVGMAPRDIEEVSRWIRLTATHACTVEQDGIDCALFMDMDMAILGKPWDKTWEGCTLEGTSDCDGYRVYAMRDVVEEYCKLKKVPTCFMPLFQRFVWCWGRAGFLKKTTSPFTSLAYKQMYDAQAKTNIQMELKHWQSMQKGTIGTGIALACLGVASIAACLGLP